MADDTPKAPEAAPAQAGGNPNAGNTAPNITGNQTIQRPATAQGKPVAQSPVVTNPTPARDLEALTPAEDNTPDALPQGTLAEMESGRKALERNRPVHARTAENRAETERKG